MAIRVATASRPAGEPLESGRALAREARSALGTDPKALIVFAPYRGLDHRKLLQGILSEASCPLIGGTTYGGIHGAKLLDDSVVLMALGGDLKAAVGRGTGLASRCFEAGREAAEEALSALGSRDAKLFVIVHEPQMGDPLRIVEGARSVLGEQFPIVGGGSGTGTMMEQSPLSKQFLGEKVLAGCVAGLLLAGDFRFSCGFSHGGVPVSRPYQLTKARGNIVVEFDGRPALDVLEEALETSYAEVCPSFTTIALGLVEPGRKDFVSYGLWGANPKERTLYCGTPIPFPAAYRFVHTQPQTILSHQKEAMEKAVKSLGRKLKGALCFDCYARKLALGAHGLIDAELKVIQEALGDAPLAGMYSGSETAVLDWGSASPVSRFAHGSTSFVLFAD